MPFNFESISNLISITFEIGFNCRYSQYSFDAGMRLFWLKPHYIPFLPRLKSRGYLVM